MTPDDLRSIVHSVLTKAGLTRRGRTWVMSSPDLMWLLELDKSPYGEQYSIDLGVALTRLVKGAPPARPTDCPILLHLENMPLTGTVPRHDLVDSFDLTSDLDDDERAERLESILTAIASYVSQTASESALRVRFIAGDFKSAFIRYDVRQTLEDDQPTDAND